MLEVGRAVEAHLLICRDNHIPAATRGVPEDLGITEVLPPVSSREDGITLILRVALPSIGAVGKALRLPLLLPDELMRRIEGKECSLTEARHPKRIADGTA